MHYPPVFQSASLGFHRTPVRSAVLLLFLGCAAIVYVAIGIVAGSAGWLAAALVIVPASLLFLWIANEPNRGLQFLIISLPLISVGVIEMGWSVRPAQMVMMLLLACVPFSTALSGRKVPLAGWIGVYFASLVFAMCWGFLASGVGGVSVVEEVSLRASAIRPVAQLVTLGLGLAVLPITVATIRSPHQFSIALRTLLGMTTIVTLYGLYQPVAVANGWPFTDITLALNLGQSATTNYGETRFYSALVGSFAPRATFPESLHFGAYLVGILPLTLACWLGRSSLPERWRSWPWAPLTILLSLALLLTLSRSSWIAVVVGLALVLLGARRLKAWLLFTACAGVIYFGWFAFTQLSVFDASLSPMGVIVKRLSMDTMATDPRWLYHGVLVETAIQHPLFGVGLGNFALIGAERLGMETIASAHSVWMAHWVEGGLVGVTALLLLFGAIARYLRRGMVRAKRTEWYYPLLGLCAGIVAMSLQYFTFGDRFAPHYWFLVALAVWVATHVTKRSATVI